MIWDACKVGFVRAPKCKTCEYHALGVTLPRYCNGNGNFCTHEEMYVLTREAPPAHTGMNQLNKYMDDGVFHGWSHENDTGKFKMRGIRSFMFQKAPPRELTKTGEF